MDDNKIEAYNEIGKLLVEEVQNQLLKYNKRASGDLINSINYRLNIDNNAIEIDLLGESYLVYVDKGRRPGKMPPLKDIESWMSKKNIIAKDRKSVAFAIGKKIATLGIPATNVIQKSINNIMAQTKIILADGYGKDLTNDIVTSLKEIKQGGK